MAGVYVYCPRCKEQVCVEEIKILDVWEGVMGEDTVRYICPHCSGEATSVVRGRYYDPAAVDDYYQDEE